MSALDFELDDAVLVRRGWRSGQVGIVEEIDESDALLPYGVDLGTGPLVWFGPEDLKPADGAR